MLEDEKKVAVALLYDKINSPRVVAKGRDETCGLNIGNSQSRGCTDYRRLYLLAETLAKIRIRSRDS